ncbi:hypothetical protein BJ322DRAFT_637005 [Thelephora terrestris]|uniref:Autophagy-related protein 27 n=1 Tax=Thelephora terrestris TaxID=56493 RepID=A0A9P6HK77_9AGAM|nr:hypothetical protein BJ322DRAFT_637005 [Thelephora terrestris]
MFPPRSLGLVLATGVYAAAARQSISKLYGACEVTVDRSRYDLCPLFHDRGQDRVFQVRAEISPITQLYYEISLGGPLNVQGGDEAEPQCPPGTWVCLRERQMQSGDSESHFTQAIPIAGDFAIGTPRTPSSSRLEVGAYRSTHNGELEIDLKEVMWRDKPQAVHFRFICDQHAQEPSLPVFTGMTAGVHNFEWSTPHACVKEHPSFSALSEDEDSTPPGEEALPESDETQGLVDALPVHHTVRNLMVVLVAASSAVLGLGYLIRYPQPQLKRWVGVATNKLPSRAREGILVQWAEETMFINDEEDIMVNYEEERDSDEYIPLKPSPTRLSARFMDYGSARR